MRCWRGDSGPAARSWSHDHQAGDMRRRRWRFARQPGSAASARPARRSTGRSMAQDSRWLSADFTAVNPRAVMSVLFV